MPDNVYVINLHFDLTKSGGSDGTKKTNVFILTVALIWWSSVALVRNWPGYLLPLLSKGVLKTYFLMNGFTLKTCFDTKTKDVSEMAYWFRTQMQKVRVLGTGLNVLWVLCTLHMPMFWHYFCDVDNPRCGHWRSRHGDWQLHQSGVPYGLWVQGKGAWKIKNTF